MKTLQERLKHARTSKGMSQADLGKAIGKSQSAIAALESGRNRESTNIASISRVLGINALWLETGQGDMKSKQANDSDSVAIMNSFSIHDNSHGAMKTIEETYRERLQMLIEKHGGQTNLGKLIDKSPTQISQWINASPDSKTGKPRSLKSDTAREIEIALDLPKAWFDQPISVNLPASNQDEVPNGYIRLKLLDISAAAGSGRFNIDFPEYVRLIDVQEDWARKHLGKNLQRISIITASGDSMHPTFADGDLLFVDKSIDFYDNEGVYVIATAGGVKVKRLQVMTNGDLKIISDNKSLYESEVLSKDSLNDIKICAKVTATWTLNNL